MSDALDFTITDYVQRLSAWATIGARTGASNKAIAEMADAYRSAVLVPVCGKAVQKLGTTGFEPDGWMTQRGAFRFQARAALERAVISGWLPPHHSADVTIAVSYEGAAVEQAFVPGTLFRIDVPVIVSAETEGTVRIDLSSAFQPSASTGGSGDTRRLGCIVQSIEFQ